MSDTPTPETALVKVDSKALAREKAKKSLPVEETTAVREGQMRRVPVNKLVPHERNPRKISEATWKPVMESIKRFGFGAPLVVQSGSNRVLAGHTRLIAAKKLGMTSVPCIVMELSDAEADALLLADNRLGENGVWDRAKIDDYLAGMAPELVALTGFVQKQKADFDRQQATIEQYQQREIRQIVLLFSGEEFPRLLEMLAIARKTFGVEDNSAAVQKALESVCSI